MGQEYGVCTKSSVLQLKQPGFPSDFDLFAGHFVARTLGGVLVGSKNVNLVIG